MDGDSQTLLRRADSGEQNAVLFTSALGFGFGIWLASKTQAGFWPLWLLIPLAFVWTVFRGLTLRARWLCFPLMLIVGLLWAQPALNPQKPSTGTYGSVTATVYGDPDTRNDGRIALTLCHVTLDGVIQPGYAYCTLYPDLGISPEALFDGASLRFRGSVYLPQPPQNAYDFDFRMWLLQQGIAYGLSGVRDLQVLNTRDTAPWTDVAGRVRNLCAQNLTQAMGKQGALAMAMLLGDRDGLAEDENAAFQRAGVAHLMSVSGLHVGLLAAALMWLLNALYLRRAIRLPIMGLFLALYCALTGLSAATLRAAAMLLLALMAQGVGRKPDPLATLGGAAILVLVIQPLQLFSAGFVLSFSAMVGILLLYKPLLAALERLMPSGERGKPLTEQEKPRRRRQTVFSSRAGLVLTPGNTLLKKDVGDRITGRAVRHVQSQSAGKQGARRRDSRLQKGGFRFCGRVRQLLAVSLAAQAGVLLPTAAFFHRLPTYGILFNLLAVPLAGVLVPLYAIVLLVSFLPWVGAALAAPPGWVAAQGSSLLQWLIKLSDFLPGAQVRVPSPNGWAYAGLGLGVLAMSRFVRAPFRRRAVAFLAAVVIACAGAYAMRPAALRYHQFAVGQGDAALLIDGEHTLAIDAGPYGGEMAGRLLAEGRDLDALILTHLHLDHAQGLSYLLQQGILIHKLYLPEGATNGDLGADSLALLTTAREAGIPVQTLKAGDEISTPNIRIQVLWPQAGRERHGLDANERSLATLIRMGDMRILSMGDNSSLYDRYFATACDVLKVAHHGSREGTSEALLNAACPQYAIITCEANKALPSQDTLNRLAKHDVKVLRTDVTGELELEARDDGFRLRFWNTGGADEP